MPMLREIYRVMRPGGRLMISTPNPASLSKLFKLAMGGSPLEPYVWEVIPENNTFMYKGKMFTHGFKETKLWTAGDLREVLGMVGLKPKFWYYYGNTVSLPGATVSQRLRTAFMRGVQPMFRRMPISGGSLFLSASKPTDPTPGRVD
jgi:SAM-dependent methyltransferase